MTNKQLFNFRRRIGQKLKEHRWLVGLSQRDMVDKLDITYQMYQKYEYGSTAMDVTRFVEICKVLGTDPGELLNAVVHNGRRQNV